MSEIRVFDLKLTHLAPDARRAGVDFPPVELKEVSAKDLLSLLEALARIAPEVAYPAVPEVRITAAEGQFLVQVKEGRVHLSSWANSATGTDFTPAQILAAITGEEVDGSGRAFTLDATELLRRPRRYWQIAALVLGIVGSNVFTAWMLTRPPPSLLPEYQLLEPEPAQRLLAATAGTYETGSSEGDRRLGIAADGRISWVKFGPKKAVAEESTLTAQAARSGGNPALLTSAGALIEIKDPITVVFFGDTYRRVLP